MGGASRDVHHWRDSEEFTDTERDVLELAEAMTFTPTVVTDDLFGRLRARFTSEQLVELGATIATENYIARFNRMFDIEAEGFSGG